MNEVEVHVTDLTARILKNAGFNLITDYFYNEEGKLCIAGGSACNWNEVSEDCLSAPTQSQAMKWLRDKKVYVWVTPIEVNRNSFFVPISINTDRWEATVWYDRNHFASAYYSKYEDAEDAGIRSGAQFVKELKL